MTCSPYLVNLGWYLELGDRMPRGWKRTQKNQANRIYPGTSQANFFRFSSLSQIDMFRLVQTCPLCFILWNEHLESPLALLRDHWSELLIFSFLLGPASKRRFKTQRPPRLFLVHVEMVWAFYFLEQLSCTCSRSLQCRAETLQCWCVRPAVLLRPAFTHSCSWIYHNYRWSKYKLP